MVSLNGLKSYLTSSKFQIAGFLGFFKKKLMFSTDAELQCLDQLLNSGNQSKMTNEVNIREYFDVS